MPNKPADTKTALMEAGGQLFAEHGFEGTSTRAIADKAGANIAAVCYYFGGKEKLYFEVISHAIVSSRGATLDAAVLDKLPTDDPKPIHQAIARIITELFELRFSKSRPPWIDKIIMRALFERPPGFEDIVRKYFQVDHEALQRLALRANPALTERQAHHWALSVFGQLIIYTVAKDALLIILGESEYKPNYIESAVKNVIRVSIAGLYCPIQETDTHVDQSAS